MIWDRMDATQTAQPQETQPGPQLTALIVSRNVYVDLRRCIEALESSTVRGALQIVVVDNGSRDGSAELQGDFPNVTFLRLPKNFGMTKALNIGTRTAKTEMVLLIGTHVEVAPDALSVLVDRLEHDNDAGAVAASISHAYSFPDAAALSRAWREGELPNRVTVDPNADAVAVDYPAGAPILVWKRFLKGMNYLDERYGQYWADLELCFQIRNAGKKILVLPAAKVHYGERPESTDPIESADCASGAAAYIGKRYGFPAGLRFRMGAMFTSLLKAVTLQRPGYNFKRLTALATGQKIDGTQE
jgi:GT2 family glycosyltransferase